MDSSSSSDRSQSDDLIYAFEASPGFNFANPGILFAARVSGLYRSLDAGKTWKLAYDSLGLQESLPTPAVAIYSNFESKGQFEVFAGVSGGVLHSIDGGKTWQIMRFGSPPPVVSALVISPNYEEDGILLAGTVEDGVFRSADRGNRWTAWNFGLLDLQVISLAISPNFSEDETILAGTDSGVFRSTNGGRAWREVNLPVGYDPVLSLAFSPNFAQDSLAWAGTEAKGPLVSSDGGENWERIAEAQINGPVNAILVSPDFARNPDLLILQGEQLLVSRDRGQAWEKWREDPALEPGVSAVLAPLGFGPKAIVLAGLSNGEIITVR
jgi:photosystem II stability/assembly factor-like uncharacterized protein